MFKIQMMQCEDVHLSSFNKNYFHQIFSICMQPDATAYICLSCQTESGAGHKTKAPMGLSKVLIPMDQTSNSGLSSPEVRAAVNDTNIIP